MTPLERRLALAILFGAVLFIVGRMLRPSQDDPRFVDGANSWANAMALREPRVLCTVPPLFLVSHGACSVRAGDSGPIYALTCAPDGAAAKRCLQVMP